MDNYVSLSLLHHKYTITNRKDTYTKQIFPHKILWMHLLGLQALKAKSNIN